MADRTVRVRLQAAVAGFTASMAQASATTRAFGSKFGQMTRENSEAMRTMGTVGLVAGGTIVAGLGKAVGAAANFESEMNRVGAMTGATGDSFDQLSDQAQELGRTTMFSASEAAQGMSFLAMAGFETNEIMTAMPSTLDLAAAGQLELAQAADIASNVLTGYGKSAEEIGEVNDVIAATATSANTSVDQMGQAMSMVAPIANSSGLQFEETAAAIGMLGDAGIQGTRAGTTLRQMLASLESPTGPAAAAIEELGIQTHDSSGQLLALTDIIGQLEEQGATTGDVMEIFGNRAGPGLSALMEMGSDSLKTMTGELENSGGAAEEMAERQMEGLKGAMTELGSATEGLMIAFGQHLSPALEGTADGINRVVTSMAEMPAPAQKAITWTAGLGGAALTAGGGFLMLAPRITATKDALSGMGPMAQGTARMMGRLGKAVGIGAAVWAASEALSALDHTLADMSMGAIPAVDDLTLALQGLSNTGQVPDSVTGSLDGLADFVDRMDAGGLEGFSRDVNRAIAGLPFGAGRLLPGMGKDITQVERFDEAAQNLGNTLAELVKAGDTEAVAVAFERAGISADEAREKFPQYAKALDEVRVAQQESGEWAEDVHIQFGKVEDGTDATTEATEELAATVEEAISISEAYSEALNRVARDLLNAASAEIDFLDALEQVSASVEKNGTELDVNTEAGRRNRDAIISATEAAYSHAEAVLEETGSTASATAAAQGHIDALKDELTQAGFTQEQIANLTAEYGLVPEQIRTHIQADLSDAERSLQRFRGILNDITGTHFMGLRGTATLTRSGAPSARMHSGGPIGGDGAEQMILAQPGEFVVNRSDASRHMRLLEAINSGEVPTFHEGGKVSDMPSRAMEALQSSGPGGFSSALDRADRFMDRWDEQIERAEQASRRAELQAEVESARSEVDAAESADERSRAEDRLSDALERVAEHDRDAARAAAEKAVADARATVEAKARLDTNREQWIFDRSSGREQIRLLDEQIDAEEAFTDRWMDLQEQRRRVVEGLSDEEQVELGAASRSDLDILREMRAGAGLEASPESNAVWLSRMSAGDASFRDVAAALAERAHAGQGFSDSKTHRLLQDLIAVVADEDVSSAAVKSRLRDAIGAGL